MESLTPVSKSELFVALPPEWNDPRLFSALQAEIRASGRKVVVLDDDPTGTQTVHDISVLTQWPVDALRDALADDDSVFYILTNSRSVPADRAAAMNVEIARNLAHAARQVKRDFVVVSRSDSTLRGHYPVELDALRETLERELGYPFDGHVIVPFFLEGGRFTIGDSHWVQEGERLIPAAQTEYARDATFGYAHSNLREWIEEKTDSRYRADEVVSISLDAIRREGPAGVAEILGAINGYRPIIVNAASDGDMQVFVAGLLRAEANGKRFLFRTAASFVRARGAFTPREMLKPSDLYQKDAKGIGGLVVVGSYIQKSSEQLRALQALDIISSVELNVMRVLYPSMREHEITHAAGELDSAIQAGRTALIFTSRELVTGATRAQSLLIGQSVSGALIEVVRRLAIPPRFVIAKGGITCSDVATRALGVVNARVLGQIAPGVPVWRLGDESRFPGMPYVVFPGNVGARDTLAQVVEELRK